MIRGCTRISKNLGATQNFRHHVGDMMHTGHPQILRTSVQNLVLQDLYTSEHDNRTRGTVDRFPAAAAAAKHVSLPQNARTTFDPSLALYSSVKMALSVGLNRPGCEADQSPPSTSRVKN